MDTSANKYPKNTITGFTLLSPGAFFIALMGFFLTFTDINCNGQKLDSVSGIELVTGYKQELGIDKSAETPETERYDPNIFALNAFIAALLGIIIFAIKKFRTNYALTTLVAVIGFVCMLMLMIDLKTKLANAQKNNSTLNIDLNIEFEMKIGYWIVTACFLLAAAWNFLKMREANRNINAELPEEDFQADENSVSEKT